MPKVTSSQKTKVQQKIRSSKIPYARGFYPSTEDEQVKAIGYKLKALPKEYSDVPNSQQPFFTAIPEPQSEDDWLAQYVEEGQSFSQYLKENPWFSRRKGKFMMQKFVSSGNTILEKYPDGKIYIAKIGDFSSSDVLFRDLIDYVQRFLCIPVQIFEGLQIEKKDKDLIIVEDPSHNPSSRPGARVKRTTLGTRYNPKTKHVQIQVDSILPKLRNVIPHDALCLIGLTPFDLYGDDSDLFVAGMAAGIRQVAIFSLLRYNPALSFSKEHWFDIKETKSICPEEKRRLTLQRACKLLVHELCHLLGVAHCIYYSCCMNGSGHLQEDFDQPMMLCPVDLHKLQALIGFNIVDRYKNLLEFCQKNKFINEANWIQRRLRFLE